MWHPAGILLEPAPDFVHRYKFLVPDSNTFDKNHPGLSNNESHAFRFGFC
jgi:hypothetical protein